MQLGIVAHAMTEPRVEPGDQLQRLRHFLLDPEIHLQPQLLAQLGDRRLALLCHEDEDRQEDRLERDDRRHQPEGEWIDRPEAEVPGIPEQPDGEADRVSDEEPDRARDLVEPVDEALQPACDAPSAAP